MYIDVDYNPSPSNSFFVSIGLNDKEALSFDNTTKGQRITKQILTSKKDELSDNGDQKLTSEWDIIELKDGKFINKRHVRWVDKGETDEIDGEVWKTEWSKSMPDEIKEKMLKFSQLVSDNYSRLEDYQQEMEEYSLFIGTLINEYK